VSEGITEAAGKILVAHVARDAVLREHVRSDFPTHVQNGEGTSLIVIFDGVDVLFRWPEGLL
jgi:hypothetical protein